MILYQIQLLIWCWVQYLLWQGERNESADYKFSPQFKRLYVNFSFRLRKWNLFSIITKKKRTKNYSPYFKTKMLRNSSFSVWIQTAPTLPIWNYFPKEKYKVIFLWLMKDHNTEAQIWYITIGRKFIGCSLACFLSVFSFMFCYTFL